MRTKQCVQTLPVGAGRFVSRDGINDSKHQTLPVRSIISRTTSWQLVRTLAECAFTFAASVAELHHTNRSVPPAREPTRPQALRGKVCFLLLLQLVQLINLLVYLMSEPKQTMWQILDRIEGGLRANICPNSEMKIVPKGAQCTTHKELPRVRHSVVSVTPSS